MIQVRECEGGACLFENGRFFGPEFPDADNAQDFIDSTPISLIDGHDDIAAKAADWIRDHQPEAPHADH